jgi:hypothetical protein
LIIQMILLDPSGADQADAEHPAHHRKVEVRILLGLQSQISGLVRLLCLVNHPARWPLSSGPTTILWVLRPAAEPARSASAPDRRRDHCFQEVAGGMDVHFVSDDGIEQHPVGELERLLARDDGLVWVDIPVGAEEAAQVLREIFGFHPLAVQACVERNAVPKVRAYRDHIFVILHAPEFGKGGHVHYVELDQFIGPRYVVTVHGPVNPAVTPDRPSSCPMRSSRPWPRARRRSWRP